jgi:hypothetical protein
MTNIANLLELAKQGNLEACNNCPWSPKIYTSISFGVSCTEHGLDWKNEQFANSMLFVQDPADTTPNVTGRLCSVHNAQNSSDKTAQQNLALWKAALALKADNPEAGGYLRKHYWANAIMHGASSSNKPLRDKMSIARECCSNVLEAQIRALQPNIVIATGKDVSKSLYDIGLITQRWDIFKRKFHLGSYYELNRSWLGNKSIGVYCTYHTSSRVVNQTLSSLYDKHSSEIEKLIQKKAEELEEKESVVAFLSKYNDISNAAHRGMRFLLNHWLDIGFGIREAYKNSI